MLELISCCNAFALRMGSYDVCKYCLHACGTGDFNTQQADGVLPPGQGLLAWQQLCSQAGGGGCSHG